MIGNLFKLPKRKTRKELGYDLDMANKKRFNAPTARGREFWNTRYNKLYNEFFR